MKTQKQQVKAQLNAHGYVTRNWALQHYITRLGAIMCDLKKEGISFIGDFEKHNGIKDYYYRLKLLEANFKPCRASISHTEEQANLLNVQLLDILKNVIPSWTSADEVKVLRETIKSKNLIRKQGLINKYNNK